MDILQCMSSQMPVCNCNMIWPICVATSIAISAWASPGLQGAQSKPAAAAQKLKLHASTTSAMALIVSTVSHTSQLRYCKLWTLSPARVIMYSHALTCYAPQRTGSDLEHTVLSTECSFWNKSAQDFFNNIEVPGMRPVLRLDQSYNGWLLKCPAKVLPMS